MFLGDFSPIFSLFIHFHICVTKNSNFKFEEFSFLKTPHRPSLLTISPPSHSHTPKRPLRLLITLKSKKKIVDNFKKIKITRESRRYSIIDMRHQFFQASGPGPQGHIIDKNKNIIFKYGLGERGLFTKFQVFITFCSVRSLSTNKQDTYRNPLLAARLYVD